ncbi:MAG: DUF4349 domain-containing protein [Spirochaetaceae bacterium]|nr:DUF4349 domain-containing protein [Spirochaetaceae bacterium]
MKKSCSLSAVSPFIALLTLSLLAAGCSAKADRAYSSVPAAYESDRASGRAGLYTEAAMDTAEAEMGSGPEAQTDRKLILEGTISIEVRDLSEAEEAVKHWSRVSGGYIASSSLSEQRLYCTIRLPESRFMEAMEGLGNTGALRNRQISTEDVTEQFYDMTARLGTRKILRDRLSEYLRGAKDIKDLISIETELNNVQTEIESMEGRLRRLTDRIDYATIHIDASLPWQTTRSGFQWPDFGDGFRRFGGAAADFLYGLLFAVLYIIVFGVPLVLLAALAYWITFGKAGLVRKLFARLGQGKKKKTGE